MKNAVRKKRSKLSVEEIEELHRGECAAEILTSQHRARCTKTKKMIQMTMRQEK